MASSSSSSSYEPASEPLLGGRIADTTEVIRVSKEELSKRYEEELELLTAGTHDELKRRDVVLRRAQQKRVNDADAHRKAQIRNINEMFEWEKVEAEARYKQNLVETKERLVLELSSEVVRQSRIIEEHFAQRSLGRHTSEDAYAKHPGIASAHDVVENAPSRLTSNRAPKRARISTNLNTALSHALPVEDIRKDFVAIVTDLEKRTARNDDMRGSNAGVPVVVDTLEQYIKIGPVPGAKAATDGPLAKAVTYPLGALVLVKSILSEEDFSGVITAMSAHEVIVKLGHSDTRLRVYTNQIRDRRVWVCPDHELEMDAGLIRDSKKSMIAAATWDGSSSEGTGGRSSSSTGSSTSHGNGNVDGNVDGNGNVDDIAVVAARPKPTVSSSTESINL